jgi:hypothetical protein
VAVALVLSGCGANKFVYKNNASENLIFKVPTAWKYYKLTEADKGDRVDGIAPSKELWHVSFDGSAQPAQDGFQHLLSDGPVGDAQVLGLLAYYSETLSPEQIRTEQFGFGFDPANPPAAVQAAVELVSLRRIVTKKGLVGSRVIFNVKDTKTDKWATLDGLSLLDPAKLRVYYLTLHCEASCYKSNMRTIDDVATSWTVNR